jgi:hypothetical protein
MLPVEVVRIEDQLTVPSRIDARLADVWISVKGPSLNPVWHSEFAAVAASQGAALSARGSFEFVSLSAHQGWIVARGVDLSRARKAALDELVRRLVTETNARMQPAQPLPSPRAERRRLLRRMLPDRFSTALQEWLAGRADIASGT